MFHSSHLDSASQVKQEVSYSRNKLLTKFKNARKYKTEKMGCFVKLENKAIAKNQ